MRVILYDIPVSVAAGKSAANVDVLHRYKNIYKPGGGHAAAESWLSHGLHRPLHIQNLGSTRHEEYSIATELGRGNCVRWLRELMLGIVAGVEDPSFDLPFALTLDDLHDRGTWPDRVQPAKWLWQVMSASGWLQFHHQTVFGCYGHAAYGTIAQPVVWMDSEDEAYDKLGEGHYLRPNWVMPWVTTVGVGTRRGEWTTDWVRSRLETCRRYGCSTVYMYTGGPNGGTDWDATMGVIREFDHWAEAAA